MSQFASPDSPTAIEKELAVLTARYGVPVRTDISLSFGGQATAGTAGGAVVYDETPVLDLYPRLQKHERRGEVVLLVSLAGQKTVVHTKPFYPDAVFRLPSGGIGWDEPADAAALREMEEETGWQADIAGFAGFCLFDLEWRGTHIYFPSYVFEMRPRVPVDGLPKPSDTAEGIGEMRIIPVHELPYLAGRLESLTGSWAGWGRIRAWPHRLAWQYLQARGVPGIQPLGGN